MNGEGLAIEAANLTKVYGDHVAVRDLTFRVEPGVVTGFLGPNGAGKSTTLRMLTGLVTPTSGTATIGGRPYHRLPWPSHAVGAAFGADAFHPSHTARAHLRVYAAMGGHPDSRAPELLERLGLADAADRRLRGFSTGMRQRLDLATALLGDPGVLLLDEPSNGLDPEGMRWLRGLLRDLADEGRTVLVSSHLLGEMEQLVDDVVMIRRGELVAAGPWSRLAGPPAVLVDSPDADRLAAAIAVAAEVEYAEDGRMRVHGLDAPSIADLAAANRLRVHGLSTETADLEDLFLQLMTDKANAR